MPRLLIICDQFGRSFPPPSSSFPQASLKLGLPDLDQVYLEVLGVSALHGPVLDQASYTAVSVYFQVLLVVLLDTALRVDMNQTTSLGVLKQTRIQVASVWRRLWLCQLVLRRFNYFDVHNFPGETFPVFHNSEKRFLPTISCLKQQPD